MDYYETAIRTLGGPAETRDVFRLFMLPGADHCRSGQGGGDFDWLSALESWVEKGQPPEQVAAYKLKQEPYPKVTNAAGETYVQLPRHPLAAESVDRSRPVYAYPGLAKWTGKGDPTKADSWTKAYR